MSEIAIRAARLSKSYRLYDKPSQRLADMLGFARRGEGGVRQHQALQDVSFEIRKGEKVAVIGRNGAGKSTLLKLVTQVISPTSGKIEVRGETRALLSLGAGFHPEFSGRQNAEAYLSSLGFAGQKLRGMVEEAIVFAELDDYADQPLKTYSTGMGMRLMFAAATMIRPELLVIDEVLGVGDAYFQHKSFQHINQICAAGETTVLLVSHDIYSAARLCDRMLWIDRGRLLIDASPAVVMRAYQDSIREQEERRLRAKAFSARSSAPPDAIRIIVDIQSELNRPPPTPLHIASLSLLVDGVQIATAPMTELAFGGDGVSYLIQEGSNWGEAQFVDGRLVRPLRNWGSTFHKASVAFHLTLDQADIDRIGVRIVCRTREPGAFSVRVHSDRGERTLGALELTADVWCDCELAATTPIDAAIPEMPEPPVSAADEVTPLPEPEPVLTAEPEPESEPEPAPAASKVAPADAPTAELLDAGEAGHEASSATLSAESVATRYVTPSLNLTGSYGSGDLSILSVRVLDERGRERHIFRAGAPVAFAIDYVIRRPGLCEHVAVVVAFQRDGVENVARMLCNHIRFDVSAGTEGTLHMRFRRLPLGVGRFAVTVLMAREGYFDHPQTLFFTLNPDVYAVTTGIVEIEVEGDKNLYVGVGAVIDADWSIAPRRGG